ncbi:MAG: hypothetical protein KF784_14370 [Fimbriimonadaceae bacterium]|nr:hypothetical protein [Fimbriimonadaceae bacterium]
MGNKSSSLLYGLCFGGGAALLVLAFLRLFGVGAGYSLGSSAFAAGLILIVGGVIAKRTLERVQHRLAQSNKELDGTKSQLDQQRRAIDALADGLETGILICDQRAQILYANRTASELFQFVNPVRKSILQVSLSYDLEQFILQIAAEKQDGRQEFALSYPKDRIVIVNAWPDPNEDRVFVSIYDITDLRRLERIRQDFVANVSHELRTPLASIRAMAETLLDEPDAELEKRDRYLEKMIAEIDRLTQLSSELLILSAAESNPVRKQAADLAQIVNSVVQQLEPKATAKGIQLSWEGPSSLVIEANTSQLTQIAINLIENAINYTNEGTVHVELSEEGGNAVLKVTDTGIGIATEHLPRIFERFYRVDKGRSRTVGGTGLGLSIVRHLAESHGGRVTLDSTLGQGSVFTVELPVGE